MMNFVMKFPEKRSSPSSRSFLLAWWHGKYSPWRKYQANARQRHEITYNYSETKIPKLWESMENSIPNSAKFLIS